MTEVSDGRTLREILDELAALGFTAAMRVLPGGRVECLACHHQAPARAYLIEHLERLEGASDPADMLAVVAVVCSVCGARGTLVLTYGPEASPDDVDVLAALTDDRHGSTPGTE
jgi:hypothetical protein